MKKCLSFLIVMLAFFIFTDGAHSQSGWKAKWDKTVAAAKKEGKLVVYGELTPDARKLLTSSFQKKFGIRLEWVTGKSIEVARKYLAERAAGLNLPDVFHMGGGTGFNFMKGKGAFVSLEPYIILPEVKDPKAYINDRFPALDKDMMIVALNSAYTSYVAVNTNLVKPGDLKSYRDLLDPRWKGKIVLYDPAVPSAAAGWATFMISDAFGREAGTQFLKDFAATKPLMIKNVRQQVEWVARGKYAIGVGTQHASVSSFKKLGSPIDIQRFSEGGSINPASGFIERSAKPPHPNAATVYFNWLLTDEGQAVFAKGYASPGIRKGVSIEGVDSIKIARPGEKTFFTEEAFYKLQGVAMKMSKKIFAPLRQ